jgi:hypothetical protein
MMHDAREYDYANKTVGISSVFRRRDAIPSRPHWRSLNIVELIVE